MKFSEACSNTNVEIITDAEVGDQSSGGLIKLKLSDGCMLTSNVVWNAHHLQVRNEASDLLCSLESRNAKGASNAAVFAQPDATSDARDEYIRECKINDGEVRSVDFDEFCKFISGIVDGDILEILEPRTPGLRSIEDAATCVIF